MCVIWRYRGALQYLFITLRFIASFAKNGVSMTRIESRPSRREMWDYVFFVDVEGHAEDDSVKKALNELEEHAAMIRLLGSYPRAVL